jgi:hypothetical protein
MKSMHRCAQALVMLAITSGSLFGQQVTSVSNSPDAMTESSAEQVSKAQSGFFASWRERAEGTLSEQPAWPVPLVTGSSGLIQCFRFDVSRQITPAGVGIWNFGNSKGVYLVPWSNTELAASIPPYIDHDSNVKDGFGDPSFSLKYRLAAGNASHGNYSISASIGGTLPTGSYKNGNPDATISPTIYIGKGFGRFAVQSSLGAILPVADPVTLGRVVVWNSVVQVRVAKRFWPEIENNASFYHAGPNDGRVQNFITPGIVVSRLKFNRESHSPGALVLGGGMQIATTRFHTYNHGLVLTLRSIF